MSEERWCLWRRLELGVRHAGSGNGSLNSKAEGCLGSNNLRDDCTNPGESVRERHGSEDEEED